MSESKVYALFVGIDNYQAVSDLRGAVQDVKAIETLFTERLGDSLDAVTLLDGHATRAAIIDGFRTHLCRAGAGDFAFFYYCGHGSRGRVPVEWEKLEPSGKLQTLAPADARTTGVWDLADKEVNALINEVTASGAEVVVVTDACHSSGNTRGVGDETADSKVGVARQTAASGTARTLDNFLPEAQALYAPDKLKAEGPPQPRHIAIAACQNNEVAKEFPVPPPGEGCRGAFSLAFEETVKALGPLASYVDIVNAVKMKVRDRAADQVPSLYFTGGADGHNRFLGGHAGRIDLTINSDEDKQWWLSAGAIAGIPTPAEGHATEVAIYERGAFDGATPPPTPLATAVVTDLLHQRARLKPSPSDALELGTQYLGVITQLGGAAALQVVIRAAEGANAAAQRVRDDLTGRSPLFEVVDRAGAVPVITLAVSDEAVQVNGTDGAPLQGLDYALDRAGMEKLTATCIHLANWQRLHDLQPKDSRLNDSVGIELIPVAAGEHAPADDARPHPASNGTVSLSYADDVPPRIQIRLRNDSNERLYVALLDLTDSFKSSKLFADWIPAGGTTYWGGGRVALIEIPAWRDATVRSTTGTFKAVAAIEDFDPERWTLPALLGPPKKGGTRDFGGEEEVVVRTAEGVNAFWGTSAVTVKTTR
jgi:hypothetical protein